MKRNGTDFEQDADRQQSGTRQGQRRSARGLRAVAGDGGGDSVESEAAGIAVQQRDPVQEERRGERTEQEVLECRLL